MRWIVCLMTAVAAIGLNAPVALAGSFDGTWVANLPAQSSCNYTGTMTLVVAGHDVSGRVRNGSPTQGVLVGKLDDDGDGSFMVNGRYSGSMTFHADHFEADWNNGNCNRHAQGDRALDDAQKAALAAERERRQDAYADMIKRAQAGEKVNFNELRAAAVYGPDWNFYDNKTAGLLQQADVAFKGKDCATVLEKVNQIIKLDFTNDTAHDLRADCLKKTGDRAAAAIEAGIAKGLIHSLMDSGDGHSEQTAYVVSTQREEMDVLANRHIRLRTRQTELRGADGRYFDVVQGVEVTDDNRIVDTTLKTVYFDITSFVTGRQSQQAMLDTLQAKVR